MIPLVRRRIILAGLVGLLLVADQLSKLIVRNSFALGESVRVLGDFFHLTYIRNAGGAFGITFGHPLVYFLASSIIAVFITISLYRHPDIRRWSVWALTFILAGAIGNLIDRVYLGEVVDFLDCEFFDINLPSFSLWFIRFPGYSMTRWPVFNVADSAVTVGIVLLLLSSWLDPHEASLTSSSPAADVPPTKDPIDHQSLS